MKHTHPSQLHIQELPSDQFGERPPGVTIDTIVIHSMHNPDSEDRFTAQSCKARLDAFGVSAHYLIDRDGTAWRMVAEDKKAWHAGVSKMPDPKDGREDVNAFSIGIELIGAEDIAIQEVQYQALALLIGNLLSRHPIRDIVGHSDIAPERKTDPWGLDWKRVRDDVARMSPSGPLRFCKV